MFFMIARRRHLLNIDSLLNKQRMFVTKKLLVYMYGFVIANLVICEFTLVHSGAKLHAMFQIIKRFVTYFFFKQASKKLAKRHRNPTYFQESVDRPERSRRCCLRIAFMSLVLVIFYLLLHSQVPKFYVANELDGFINTTKSDEPGELNIIKYMKFIIDPDEEIIQTKPDRLKETQYLVIKNDTLKKSSLLPCIVSVSKTGAVHQILRKSLNIDRLYTMVGMGGHYKPRNCLAQYKVAIFVPYRNRSENLRVFLYNIHPVLMHQQVEYRIFVIEQSENGHFNKGRLFNAGFLEIQKHGSWQWECIIFHDVDLLPADGRIPYTCPTQPRQMCSMVVSKGPNYRMFFGGVTAMTTSQFRQVNGYSNLYWGWGAEDNDMSKRIHAAGMTVSIYKQSFGRYVTLHHENRYLNRWRYKLLSTATRRYKLDGLNSLRYRMISYASRPLYTHVLLDISPLQQPDFVTKTHTTNLLSN